MAFSSESSQVSAVDVLVVGAGITGIYQLHRALEEGFTATLLEAGDGVGGTWFWNRYPGARFDSESYTYGYLFSKELFEEWEWQEHFAAQPETERYLNHVVDRFDLRRHMRFGVRVAAAVWDEPSGRYGTESTPVAVTRKRATVVVPSSVVTAQVAVASSQTAAVTVVPKRMWRRRSNRSTTWFR